MSLTSTKWASGTAGTPSTDPNLNSAPVMNTHLSGWPSAGEIYVQSDDPDLLFLEADFDDLDIHFQDTGDLRHKYQPAQDGRGITVVGSRIGGVDVLQVYRGLYLFDYFGIWGENQDWFDWGLTRELMIQPPSVTGTVTATTEIYVPYAWMHLDLAEILWSWTKFHNTLSSQTELDAILDKQSFLDYSARMDDRRWRQWLSVRRKVDATLQDQIAELLDQTAALFAWGGRDTNDVLTAGLQIFDPLDVATNSRLFRFDHEGDEENPLGIVRPKVRIKDTALVNQLDLVWGSASQALGPSPPLTVSHQSPAGPPEEENKHRLRDQASVDTFGLRSQSPSVPNAIDAGSAVGPYRINRWSDRDKEVVGTMGPLHLDFGPGEIINIRDELQGLKGTEELLVTVKEIELDNLTATITAVELEPDPYLLNPKDLDGIFACYQADQGVSTYSGTGGNRVSLWEDQGPNGYDADQDGSNDGPLYTTNYRNGKPVLDFSGDFPTLQGWLEIAGMGTETGRRSNWTFLALMEIDNSAQGRHYLLSTEGGITIYDSDFLLTLGDSNTEGLGFYQNSVMHDDGPILPTDHWIAVVLQCWTTRGNWAKHEGNRSWGKVIDFQTPANSSEVDGDHTTDPLFFWKNGLMFDQRCKIGTDYIGGSYVLRGKLAELAIVEHRATSSITGMEDPPLPREQLDGVINYWVDKYDLNF